MPKHSDSYRPVTHRVVPQDMKLALDFMRLSLCRSVTMADLAQHCGVSERTLNQHFRAFLGVPPMRYMRRLRLAAARRVLLSGESDISVTGIAERYAFNHFGRFAEQYRQSFGESPSTTLRRARTLKLAKRTGIENCGAREFRRSLVARDKPSIAVLPCQSPNGDVSLKWLADSIADALSVSLCAVQAIEVKVPRFGEVSTCSPKRLVRQLGARYLLTGRLVRTGGPVRVTLRLVDSATGRQIWGDCFEGAHDGTLELEGRNLEGILCVILAKIRGAEIDRAEHTSPENLDAYGLAMRALPFVFDSRPPSSERALTLLDQALEVDPDYGLVPALAAWCHAQLVMYNSSRSPTEAKRRAVQLLCRAAVLDESDPLVLASRCAVHTMVGEFDVAELLVSRALALDPTFGWAWGRSGWLNSYQGNSDTAIEHFNRAITYDDSVATRANSYAGIGSAHFDAGRYDAATYWLQRAMQEQPALWWPNRSLSVSLARLGNREAANASLTTLRRQCPDLTVSQVLDSVPFRPSFLTRLGAGLSDLGLPP